MSKPKSKPDFCCVGNYSVLIPYRDLEKLVEIGNNFEALQDRLSRTEEQLDAVRSMYTEALDKIGEIRRLI